MACSYCHAALQQDPNLSSYFTFPSQPVLKGIQPPWVHHASVSTDFGSTKAGLRDSAVPSLVWQSQWVPQDQQPPCISLLLTAPGAGRPGMGDPGLQKSCSLPAQAWQAVFGQPSAARFREPGVPRASLLSPSGWWSWAAQVMALPRVCLRSL